MSTRWDLLLFELLAGATPGSDPTRPCCRPCEPCCSARRRWPAAPPKPTRTPPVPRAADARRSGRHRRQGAARRARPSLCHGGIAEIGRRARAARRTGGGARRRAPLLRGTLLRRYRWAVAAAAAIFLSLAAAWGSPPGRRIAPAIERDIARRDASREEAVRYSLTRLFRTAIADHGAQPADRQEHDRQQRPASAARIPRPAPARRSVRAHPGRSLWRARRCHRRRYPAGGFRRRSGRRRGSRGTWPMHARSWPISSCCAGIRIARASCWIRPTHSGRASPRPYLEERLEGLAGAHAPAARARRSRGGHRGHAGSHQQRIALSGHDHRETAILYNSLAISLTAANRLDQALAAYHETSAIYRAIGLGDGIDAQIIVANTGTLELRSRPSQGSRSAAAKLRRARTLACRRFRRGGRRDGLLRQGAVHHQSQ